MEKITDQEIEDVIQKISAVPRWECYKTKIDAIAVKFTPIDGIVKEGVISLEAGKENVFAALDGILRDILKVKLEYESPKRNKRRAKQRAKKKAAKVTRTLEAFQL